MEGRMKKYRQVSPERAIVWTEKSPKYQYNHQYNQNQQQQHTKKISVIYYLCRNRQLEHPHFMEFSLSSSDDLYLRDVIERLNVLRGSGIASMYSWSYKRSYKNGYVWHDLCYDDIIHPAHGNEYILKGSELFEEPNPGRSSPATNSIIPTQTSLPEPPSSRNQEQSSSLSSLNGRTTKNYQDDDLSTRLQAMSPELSFTKNSSCKFHKCNGAADASTQTEEIASIVNDSRHMCTRGVLTDDVSLEPEISGTGTHGNIVSEVKQTPEICNDIVPPPPCKLGASSLSGRTDTLESLVRADIKKLKILTQEGCRIPSSMKLKATNMILQLISCGSISVKDYRFGLIPTYRPRFSHSKFHSTSLMLRKLDCLQDKECFSESLNETSMLKEYSEIVKSDPSNGGSKRMTEPLCLEKQSTKPDSSRSRDENAIKIEESLLQELGS